ncbi:MAG: ATPase, T2SS/T4P/T4SS family, partial [Pirellulales bacterium]|nr:ATPase, T2SS/T4P/T4SS family [Pirellulales bacterium]
MSEGLKTPMASKQQQLFAKIVLHNKLLQAPEVEQLMRQFADPEEVIQHLIATDKLNEKTGSQLRGLYEKQLEKLGIPREKVAATETSEADSTDIDALVEEALEEEQDTETPVDAPAPAESAGTDSTTERIQVDLDEEAEARVVDDAEEELPVLERDTQSDERSVRIETPSATVAVDSKSKELIHDILREARELKASDVHITAGLAPMIRQAGSLKTLDRPPLPPEVTEGGLLAMLDEGRRAQFLETNDLDFCYDGGEELGRFRTNFLREQSGVDGVFRLIDTVVPSFEQLGLPEQIQRFTDYAVGIVLITGPKGSGKTTTLAAMVDLLNGL